MTRSLPRGLHQLVRLLAVAGLLLFCTPAGPLGAQSTVEPYQFIFAGLGGGALEPREIPDTVAEAADAGGALQLFVGIDLRRSQYVTMYARLDADVAEIRQHIGGSVGLRVKPRIRGNVRPYAGIGGGVVWAVPRYDLRNVLEREFGLRGEALLGVDWEVMPGLRWFLEYRYQLAQLEAVWRRAGCETSSPGCFSFSGGAVWHSGHTGWTGLRIKLF